MDNTGDHASMMENIYREIGPELLAFFRRRHDSPQTAEDLLQETFAAVMKNPDRLLRRIRRGLLVWRGAEFERGMRRARIRRKSCRRAANG